MIALLDMCNLMWPFAMCNPKLCNHFQYAPITWALIWMVGGYHKLFSNQGVDYKIVKFRVLVSNLV